MVYTLVGWSQSVGTGSVFVDLDAIKDPHVRVEGKNVIVPSLNNLLGAFAISTNLANARVSSPSLRSVAELSVHPMNVGTTPISNPPMVDIFERPIPLVVDEPLSAKAYHSGAAAEQVTVLAWLGDGPVTKVTGPFYTVKATSSTTLTAYTWTNCIITFEQTLPAGRYQIIGFGAKSAGIIAARLVIPGFGWRPGVIGNTAYSHLPAIRFRYGNCGVLGEFASTSPPTVDVLSSSADTSEEFWFDLIKVA